MELMTRRVTGEILGKAEVRQGRAPLTDRIAAAQSVCTLYKPPHGRIRIKRLLLTQKGRDAIAVAEGEEIADETGFVAISALCRALDKGGFEDADEVRVVLGKSAVTGSNPSIEYLI